MTSNPKPRKCEEKKLTALTRKAFPSSLGPKMLSEEDKEQTGRNI